MKNLGIRSVKNNPYWNWVGDFSYSIEFGDCESLYMNLFTLEEYPEVSYLVPSEAYTGSGFAGCGIWSNELEVAKLLAFARISTWELTDEN